MFKKWSLLVGLCVLLLSLTACNSSEKASSTNAKSKAFEANIESATYVILGEDDGVSENKNLGQIAVNIKVKNTSKNSINLSNYEGIVLYDGDEQLDPLKNTYNSKLDLEYDHDGKIGSDKVKTITVIFEVEKDKEYNIGLKPISDDYNEEIEELTLKLATADYAESYDKLQDSAKAATAYIDTIYFDKENSDYEKFVTADKAADQEKAKNVFKDRLDNIFEEELPDKEVVKLYSSYKDILAQKAKIGAKTIATDNEKAVVSLDYTSVPLKDIWEKAYKYEEEYRDKTGSYDSEETDQYVLSKFDLILNSYEPKKATRPLEIVMIQKDGKWQIDSSDNDSEKVDRIFAEGSEY